MVKALLYLAVLGCLGWLALQHLDLGASDGPTGPSVQYPVIDADDSVGGVGDKTGGLLGP